MKKTVIIFFSSLVLISAFAGVWFYPVYSPLSGYVKKCRPDKVSVQKGNDLANLKLAETNFKECKIALAENDKLSSNKGWKSKSFGNIYDSKSYTLLMSNPQKFKYIRESNAILDQIMIDSFFASSLNAKVYKSGKRANQILDETKSIIDKHISYKEITRSDEMIENHRKFIYKKYLKN